MSGGRIHWPHVVALVIAAMLANALYDGLRLTMTPWRLLDHMLLGAVVGVLMPSIVVHDDARRAS